MIPVWKGIHEEEGDGSLDAKPLPPCRLRRGPALPCPLPPAWTYLPRERHVILRSLSPYGNAPPKTPLEAVLVSTSKWSAPAESKIQTQSNGHPLSSQH